VVISSPIACTLKTVWVKQGRKNRLSQTCGSCRSCHIIYTETNFWSCELPNIICSSSSWKKQPIRVLRDKKQYLQQIPDLWERHYSSIYEHTWNDLCISNRTVRAVGRNSQYNMSWFNFSLNYHRHSSDKKEMTSWELHT